VRAERAIVAAHADLGVAAERVPLSRASRYRGNGADVDIYPFGRDAWPLCCQVKARASGEGFATLERWLGDADALFLRRDRAEPLVVLPWATWTRLVPGMPRPGSADACDVALCRTTGNSSGERRVSEPRKRCGSHCP
jgi:hypothetical protein